MDIHPIIVHFPVAFLTIYGIAELVRFSFVTRQSYWFYVKGVLVIVGSVSSLGALWTGEQIAEQVEDIPRIMQLHSMFAQATVWIFGVVALAYFVTWLQRGSPEAISRLGIMGVVFQKYSSFVMRPSILVVFALLGLAAVTITGGLGGAMVYGLDFDPLMKPVFKFLGL